MPPEQHQNMYDGEARSFNFPTAVSSWYPEPSMAGVLFSPSVGGNMNISADPHTDQIEGVSLSRTKRDT